MFKVGDTVMVPRSNGSRSVGTVVTIYTNQVVKVRLAEKGSRGQPLGKYVEMNELTSLEEGLKAREVDFTSSDLRLPEEW